MSDGLLNQTNQQWLFFLALVLALVVMLWANYSFSVNNPGGNDFLVYYHGTRALLFEGLSPYSEVVAERIQTQAYGRLARKGEHKLGFVYPLFSLLLFAPFSLLEDYLMARAVWMTAIEVGLFVIAYLSMRIVGWKPKIWLKTGYFLFSILWYHAVRGLINGNAVVFVTLFVVISLFSIKKENYQVAGVALAFSAIKPNVVVLPVIFIIYWSLSRKDWRVTTWFLGSIIVLAAGGMLVVPSWIIQNLQEIARFPSYNPTLTLGGVLGEWLPGIRIQIKVGLAFLAGGVLLYEWYLSRKKSFHHFLWVCCLTFVVGQWIGIPTDPGNFIVLFPVITLVIAISDQRWKDKGGLIAAALLLLLFIGLWVVFLATLKQAYQPIQSPLMFLPLPGLLLIGLYWVRWWVSKPHYLIMQENKG